MPRIHNPTAHPCVECGAPTVLAEYPAGLHRVHCGTYRYACPATPTPKPEVSLRRAA